MHTPVRLSIVRKAAPVLTDANTGIGVAVLVLAASWTGAGPQWIANPRSLDLVAVGLIGIVAGALAVRGRYPIAVLVVLNAVTLAWSAAQYPGRLISGMRERALALSGQFTAGPCPDGGFQVRCALPTTSSGGGA